MKRVYKCDFCEEFFETETQAKEHEVTHWMPLPSTEGLE